jgi:peptidoglycan hydrolase CwlO-like protein
MYTNNTCSNPELTKLQNDHDELQKEVKELKSMMKNLKNDNNKLPKELEKLKLMIKNLKK